MQSVQDADLVLVGDTGSTDNTISLFKKHGATVHSIMVEPWRFDVARNQVMGLVPSEYDCLFSIDIDEIITTSDWKQKILSVWGYNNCERIKYYYQWSPERRFIYNKIHSRNYRWIKPCHEVLQRDTSKEKECIQFVDMEVVHLPDNTKSRGSYLALLKLALQEDPSDARMIHYYGRELYFNRNWEQAISVLTQHSQINNAWAAERAESCIFIGYCFIELDNMSEADKIFKKACQICPNERKPYIEYAKFLLSQERYSECYAQAKIALSITTRYHHYLEDRYSWCEGPYDLIGVSAHYLGLKEESEVCLRQAAIMNPKNPRLINNLKYISPC